MAITFGAASTDSNGVAVTVTGGPALSSLSGVVRIYPSDVTNYQDVLVLNYASGLKLSLYLDPTAAALLTMTESAVDYTPGSMSLSLNAWWSLGFTYDGTTLQLYKHTLSAPNQAPHTAAATTLTSIQIGSQPAGAQSAYKLQDVAIYSGVFTDAEMALAFASRNPVPGRTLQAWYPMMSGGARLDDFSGQGRDLAVTRGSVSDATVNAPAFYRGQRNARTLPPQYFQSTLPLAGTVSSGSTFSGTAQVAVALAGSENVASTLSGALTVPKNLAAGSTVASTLSAALSVALALNATTTSATTLAATMSQTQPLLGSDTSASTLAATLSQAQPLLGSDTVASTLAATLTQQQPLVGSTTSASTLSATLRLALALAGSDSVASTLAGTLTVPKNLAGSDTVASTLSGTVVLQNNLAGSDTVASTLAATLTQAQPLVGTETVASTLAATLDVTKPLAGSDTNASTFSGTLGITGLFQGNAFVASTFSGTLGVLRQVAGSETVASTFAGTLSQAQPLAASSTVASTLAGALSLPKNLAGSDTSASTLSATVSVLRLLVGSSSVASTLTAALTVPKPLAGTSSVASTLAASLGVANFIAGSMGVSSTLTAAISGGTPYFPPVWAGWSDGGDIPDVDSSPGPWVPDGTEWTGELHGAWASDGEGEMAGHGKWHEDPVSGGTVLYPERWRGLKGASRTASTLRGVLALGPQPTLLGLMPGGAFGMVKDWQFGSTKTISNAAALNTEFTYHDPFGTISNGTNYGALIQRAAGAPTFGVYNWADVGMANDQQPEDTTGRYRTWTSTTMQAHVKPLNTASTVVGPASTHNAGCGSLVSKYTLPAGGARLGQDIVWETRARILNAPNGYWFALWMVGPQWDGGPEIDAIEAFSSSSPNVNGDLFNANSIGGTNSKDYFSGGWDTVLSTLGLPGYAIPNGSQSLRNWHTFTMYYAKNNAFTLYMDSTVIQSGTLDWRVPTGTTVPPLSFLFDFGFGHTGISPINTTTISDINATPLTYEIDYSRVWLR
jgi:hypothetical protein